MKLGAFYYFAIAAAIILVIAAANAKAASASGFAVSPSSLEFNVETGSQVQRQLAIYNIGKEPAEFSAASSNPQAVVVSPNTGIISGGSKAVITATAKGTKAGASSGEIVIGLSSGSNKEVSLSLGTAVAVKVNVLKGAALAANAFFGVMLSAGIVATGLAGYYTLKRRVGRLSTEFYSAYDLYTGKKR
ncbi:mobile sperm domain-containing protein [Candidatus Woesearchaeota archaeon]|nr:mobile sperm domain-containing protein [Candidatus Woesearchaeota archaeon]